MNPEDYSYSSSSQVIPGNLMLSEYSLNVDSHSDSLRGSRNFQMKADQLFPSTTDDNASRSYPCQKKGAQKEQLNTKNVPKKSAIFQQTSSNKRIKKQKRTTKKLSFPKTLIRLYNKKYRARTGEGQNQGIFSRNQRKNLSKKLRKVVRKQTKLTVSPPEKLGIESLAQLLREGDHDESKKQDIATFKNRQMFHQLLTDHSFIQENLIQNACIKSTNVLAYLRQSKVYALRCRSRALALSITPKQNTRKWVSLSDMKDISELQGSQ